MVCKVMSAWSWCLVIEHGVPGYVRMVVVPGYVHIDVVPGYVTWTWCLFMLHSRGIWLCHVVAVRGRVTWWWCQVISNGCGA
jgi:hypothetical protein